MTFVTASTLVLQSQRRPYPWDWMQLCIDSVKGWARANGFAYQFLTDTQLFEPVHERLGAKAPRQKVVAADLGRLLALQSALEQGYQRALWLDADFLIFAPERLCLPAEDFAVGREVWVQSHAKGLRAYVKVHNAFLSCAQGGRSLPFYLESAERLLSAQKGAVSPQFIGPKLLTALHNVVQFSVLESAGMLSPLVAKDYLRGGGAALDLMRARSALAPAGVNLSASLIKADTQDVDQMTERDMAQVVNLLLDTQSLF